MLVVIIYLYVSMAIVLLAPVFDRIERKGKRMVVDNEILLVPNLIIEAQKLVLMVNNTLTFTKADIDHQANTLQSAIDAFASNH